jgi:hypothetical protein
LTAVFFSRYIAENFQLFLFDDKLKKRLLTEVGVDKENDVKSQENMLFRKNLPNFFMAA